MFGDLGNQSVSRVFMLCRFKIRPDVEDTFVDAWTAMTAAIRQRRGGLGSRLHRADDGLWIACALWPDCQSRERSQAADVAPHPEAAPLLTRAIEKSYTPIPLETRIDRLVPCSAEAEADTSHRSRR